MNKLKKIIIIFLVSLLSISIIACSKNSNSDKNNKFDKFPKFDTEDLMGNKVSDEIITSKDVTVINMWFTGCGPCINELPSLGKFSKVLEENGSQLIGICADAAENKDYAIKLLKESNVNYVNLMPQSSGEMKDFISKIMAYPTTLIVDKDKNIRREILGAIDSKERLDEILNIIKEIKK